MSARIRCDKCSAESYYAGGTKIICPTFFASLEQQLNDRDKEYHELLMAVVRKHPGETRHETALRYIREAETAAALGPAKENSI